MRSEPRPRAIAPWSDAETKKLNDMLDAGFSQLAIARTLRRSTGSVQGRIRWLTMTPEQREVTRQRVNRNRRYAPESADAGRRVVPADVLAERERRELASRTLTALAFGDPAPGQSALDKRGRT